MEIGTKVKMVNCYEAKKYAGRIWETDSEPWQLGSGGRIIGEWVVLLKGKSGGFALRCLEEVKEGVA